MYVRATACGDADGKLTAIATGCAGACKPAQRACRKEPKNPQN
jgi:hypothetical protein